jgi:hypothetical protein
MKQSGSLILLLLSALAGSLLLVDTQWIPSLGFATTFTLAGIWAIRGTNKPSIWTKMLFGGIVALSFMLIFRSNFPLTFINLFSILTLGTLLVITPHLEISHPAQIMGNYFLVFARLLQKKPLIDWRQLSFNSGDAQEKNLNSYVPLIASVALTILIAIVLIEVFASANPVFFAWSQALKQWITTLPIDQKMDVLIARLIVMGILIIGFNRLAGLSAYPLSFKRFVPTTFPLVMPKLVALLLCLVFIAAHSMLLLNPDAVLSRVGANHSQTTREIFGQMAVASFISLGLLTLRRDKKRINMLLSVALLACVLILTAIGLQSDYQYISEFGLTHKRLYGLASVVWLFAVSVLSATWLKRGGKYLISRGVVAITIAVVLLVNLANFDRLIATYSPRLSQQGVDYEYLSYNLSSDAGTLWQLYLDAKQDYLNSNAQESLSNANKLLYRMERLTPGISPEEHYRFDGSFNVSDLIAYNEIKKLPLENERKWLRSQEKVVAPIPERVTPKNYVPESKISPLPKITK